MIDRPTVYDIRLYSPLVLATDLDGTFAGGSESDRIELQTLLTTRSDTTLIYVTGRSLPAVRALVEERGLPHPDLLIADVGTTVVSGVDFTPVTELEAELELNWPGGDLVRERLSGLDGLVEQDVCSPRRVSYTMDGVQALAAESLSPQELAALGGGGIEGGIEEFVPEVESRLEGLDIDLLPSAGIYLDVLPRGVNKGTTVGRALEWLGREGGETLVAGDSLNDLALFDLGIRGVAVGNSETALLERLGERDWIYRAERVGAGGILEALAHFGWLSHATAE